MTDADVATKIMGWYADKIYGEDWWCVTINRMSKGVRKKAEYHPTTNIHEALGLLTGDVAKRLTTATMQDPMAICEAALAVKVCPCTPEIRRVQ